MRTASRHIRLCTARVCTATAALSMATASLVTACQDSPSAAPTSTPASNSPTPTRSPVTVDQIRRALPPASSFRSYRRASTDSGTISDYVSGDGVAPAIGLPHAPAKCDRLVQTLLVDSSRPGLDTGSAPAATITYLQVSRTSARLFFEVLAAIPPSVPADATKIQIPAGCDSYRTRDKDIPTKVGIRGFPAPVLPGAQVTAVEVTLNRAQRLPVRLRTYSVRAGHLLMLVCIGGTGSTADSTAQLRNAWTRAQNRIG